MPDFISLSQHIREALWPRRQGIALKNGALSRGASVLVGAGMSKNAHYVSEDLGMSPPSWRELSEQLVGHLCPDDKSKQDELLKTTGAVSGFLRLAQKYEARFGRPALNDLITESVGTERMTPGLMHTRLVELPWTDIFTTNWDDLLERAEKGQFTRKYDYVISPDDLPITSRPRIIKLHGSMPNNKPFIFTEEDFRTYPEEFAPFVNCVQQSMMENVFVLIGFSGEDPNFLNWTGWVRDRLKSSAPKIYLVDDFTGKLDSVEVLRSLNVKALDLGEYPEGTPGWPDLDRETYADPRAQRLGAWLEFLHQVDRTPAASWPLSKPEKDKVDAEEWRPELIAFKEELATSRARYPGWLVAPADTRELVAEHSPTMFMELTTLDDPSEDSDQADAVSKLRGWIKAVARPEWIDVVRDAQDPYVTFSGESPQSTDDLMLLAQLCAELSWLMDIALYENDATLHGAMRAFVLPLLPARPLDHEIWPDSAGLLQALEALARPKVLSYQTAQAAKDAVVLMARSLLLHERDAAERLVFDHVSRLLGTNAAAENSWWDVNRIFHQQILRLLDRKDLVRAQSLLEKWVPSRDPICDFQIAGHLGALSSFCKGADTTKQQLKLLRGAFVECRRQLNTHDSSLSIKSREAWILAFFNQFGLNPKETNENLSQVRKHFQDHGDQRAAVEMPRARIEIELDTLERLEELIAERCDPRRDLKRAERSIADLETRRQERLVLDQVGWPMRTTRLRGTPVTILPAHQFAAKAARADILEAARLCHVKGANGTANRIDRLACQGLKLAMRAGLTYADFDQLPRSAYGNEYKLFDRLAVIGGALLVPAEQDDADNTPVPGIFTLAVDCFEAAVRTHVHAAEHGFKETDAHLKLALQVLKSLTGHLWTRAPQAQGRNLAPPWRVPQALTHLKKMTDSISALGGMEEVQTKDRLEILGPVIALVCRSIMQCQTGLGVSEQLQDMVETLWNLELPEAEMTSDPLLVVQSPQGLVDNASIDNRSLRDALALVVKGDHKEVTAKKLRALRLFDTLEEFGFSFEQATEQAFHDFAKAAFEAKDSVTLRPWEWLLIEDVQDEARKRFEKEFFSANAFRGASTLSGDPTGLYVKLANISWALLHPRAPDNFPKEEVWPKLTAWLVKITKEVSWDRQEAAKSLGLIDTIFVRGVVENLSSLSEDTARTIAGDVRELTMELDRHGCEVEQVIPKIAAFLSGRDLLATSSMLGSVLRKGLRSENGARFDRSIEAMLTWVDWHRTEGIGILAPPPAMLGALSQALAIRRGSQRDRVLEVIHGLFDPEAGIDIESAEQWLPAMQDVISLALQKSSHRSEQLQYTLLQIEGSLKNLLEASKGSPYCQELEQLRDAVNDVLGKGAVP